MELRQFLKVLFHHKQMIILMFLSATITATLLTYFLSDRYRSSTMILIRPQESIDFVPKSEEILNFPVSYFQPIETASKTYTEIIKTRTIAEKVVNRLGLDSLKEKKEYGWGYIWKKTKRKIKEFLKKGWTLLKHGRIEEEDAFNRAVAEVQGGLSVKPTKETYLFELQAESTSPVVAAAIANAAAKVFVDYLREMHVSEKEGAIELSGGKMDQSMQQMEKARKAAVEFKEGHNIVSLRKEMELELELLAELEKSWKSSKTAIAGALAKRKEINRQLAEMEKFAKSSAKVTDNPLLRELRSQRAQKEIKLAKLRELYEPWHQELKSLQTEIDEINVKLRQETPTLSSEETSSVHPVYENLLIELARVETELESLKARNRSLALAIQEKKRRIKQMPQKEAELSKLELDIAVNEQAHSLLSLEHEELGITAIREAPHIRVIHDAVAPVYPFRPIKIYHAGLAGILSLIVGMGIALLMEHMNTTVRSIEEAEQRLALPVLMTLPHLNLDHIKSWPLLTAGRRELQERRRYERAYSQLPVEFRRYKDSTISKGETIDISQGGACCYVDAGLNVDAGDKVDLLINDQKKDSGETAVIEGVVLRSKEASAGFHFSTTAVGFENMDNLMAGKIQNFIEKKHGASSSLLSSRFEEAIRGLRSDLQFLNNRESSLFLITSCGPQEGKSIIVSNLAVSLSQVNKNVALVDADLRFPSLHRIFNLPNETGLTGILSEGKQPWLKKTNAGLSVLTSGPPISDPPALLGSDKMLKLLNFLNTDFDLVLIDSPPILAGPDSALLASITDEVIIVLNAGRTSVEDFRRARKILERSHAKILGTVLNNYDDRSASYYALS